MSPGNAPLLEKITQGEEEEESITSINKVSREQSNRTAAMGRGL